MRWLRWAALVPFALVLAMLAASGWLLLGFRLRPVTALALFGIGCIGALTAALGLVIAWRVRNNAVGPLLCWVGSVMVFLVGRQVYYTIAIRRPESLPLDNRVVAALEGSGWWLMAPLALLLLYFPDGRLPSHRWRLIPPALIATGALLHVSAALDSAPFLPPVQDLARPYWPAPAGVELLSICGMGLMLALFLACVASLVIRFRRSSDMQRAQLKWLALDGAALGLYPFLCFPRSLRRATLARFR